MIGKFKDETRGIEEFAGLPPKMDKLKNSHYSTVNNKTVEKKVTKETAKHACHQTKIRHEHCKRCIFRREQQMALMKQLQSFQHNIFSIKLSKIGLSPFDNKRCTLGNGCETLAYGHCTLRKANLDQRGQELIELLVDL